MSAHNLVKLTRMALVACLLASAGAGSAQVAPPPASRMPQPLPPPTAWTRTDSPDGMTTYYNTPTSNFPESDPFVNPTNLLPTVYADVNAANGVPIPNTLPSTPEHPYNLQKFDPVVTRINPASPADDLEAIFKSWKTHGHFVRRKFNRAALQRGIDILEGNPVPNRVYSGIPMLHIAGPDEVGKVVPIYDANGKPIGGNVTVHQYWFGQHIESDTSFIDPSAMLQPALRNLTWTITYVVDCLHRGNDDFTPMVMYLDDPDVIGAAKPLVMMDTTFFPIRDGTSTVFVIKEPPARFFNGVYTWGWRRHPGRVAVMGNGLDSVMGKNVVQWEIDTFGPDPMVNETNKLAAIAMIGDLAPAKRMWNALRKLQRVGFRQRVMAEYERAYYQWQRRNRLPDGVKPDPNADMTLFYVNNTIFGQMRGFSRHQDHPTLFKWHLRGTKVTVKLINGDYFPKGYVAMDFGGLRGWENTFQSTIPTGGDGPWFTFGRDYWEPLTRTPPIVPAAVPGAGSMVAMTDTVARKLASARMAGADAPPNPVIHAMDNDYAHNIFRARWLDPDGKMWPKMMPRANLPSGDGDVLGEHTVVLTLNFEPSRRLRIYQFDPLHHIQAIWSVH